MQKQREDREVDDVAAGPHDAEAGELEPIVGAGERSRARASAPEARRAEERCIDAEEPSSGRARTRTQRLGTSGSSANPSVARARRTDTAPSSARPAPGGPRTTVSSRWSNRLPTGTTRRPPGVSCSYSARGDRRRGRSDAMPSYGAPVRHTEGAVADPHLDPLVARVGECLLCLLGQLGEALDRDDVPRQLGEHRRLIPRAGADVEHALGRPRARAIHR